ncbi:AAC(3) family N-acetyltransferase [Bacteroides fragilis]|uniref:AAC(3) family N-acetyltransferase n=1 Tax=Bacteroides fragilis TaxID=817 RepID=UPI0024537950|nr:AAC(3) family N-acetyltransferase [Bacteroides fragilis]
MITFDSLRNDLKMLGVSSGDLLFLRISYKAIGRVEGGPKTFVDALLDVVGKEGTIVVTAFPSRYSSFMRFFYKYSLSNKLISKTGAISNIVLSNPNVSVSAHPTLPFAVIGAKAQELIEHKDNDSFSNYDILKKMLSMNGKCLRIGGEPFDGTTHIALTDFLKKMGYYQVRESSGRYYYNSKNKKIWYDKLPSLFCPQGFFNFYQKKLKDSIIVSSGYVGEGEAVITDMSTSYKIEKEQLFKNSYALFCDDPDCIWCRVSYSYSDLSYFNYINIQLKQLFKKRSKKALKNIYKVLLLIFFGKKCQ